MTAVATDPITAPATNGMTDLGIEIMRRRDELARLEDLQSQHETLNRKIKLVLTGVTPDEAIVGQPSPGQMIQSLDQGAKTKSRGLASLLEAAMHKMVKGTKITVREGVHIADQSGYQTTSKNVYNVVRQCLVTDKRFKKFGERGDKDGVKFGLKAH